MSGWSWISVRIDNVDIDEDYVATVIDDMINNDYPTRETLNFVAGGLSRGSTGVKWATKFQEQYETDGEKQSCPECGSTYTVIKELPVGTQVAVTGANDTSVSGYAQLFEYGGEEWEQLEDVQGYEGARRKDAVDEIRDEYNWRPQISSGY